MFIDKKIKINFKYTISEETTLSVGSQSGLPIAGFALVFGVFLFKVQEVLVFDRSKSIVLLGSNNLRDEPMKRNQDSP